MSGSIAWSGVPVLHNGAKVRALPLAAKRIVVEGDGFAYALNWDGDSVDWWPEPDREATYRIGYDRGIAWIRRSSLGLAA